MVSQAGQTFVERLTSPLPRPPKLTLEGWENRERFPQHARAIKALLKPADKVSGRDRAAVRAMARKLRGKNEVSSNERILVFFERGLSQAAFLGRDPIAAMIQRHLRHIPRALEAFGTGTKPIGRMQQPTVAYLMRWGDFYAGLDKMYKDSTERLRRMSGRQG